MLTTKRAHNKSLILRRMFLWLFVIVALAFFILVIIVRIGYDYEDNKLLQLDEKDKDSLKQDMIALERSMNKIIPEFLSNWTIVKACVVLLFAIGLIFIQYFEESYAESSDQ